VLPLPRNRPPEAANDTEWRSSRRTGGEPDHRLVLSGGLWQPPRRFQQPRPARSRRL